MYVMATVRLDGKILPRVQDFIPSSGMLRPSIIPSVNTVVQNGSYWIVRALLVW